MDDPQGERAQLARRLRRAQEEIVRLRRENERLRRNASAKERAAPGAVARVGAEERAAPDTVAGEDPEPGAGGAEGPTRREGDAGLGPPGETVRPSPSGRLAAPTLFPRTEPLPRVDLTSSPEDKIRLFRTLFRGRDDVHAVRWVNRRTGKSGYAPARGRPARPPGGTAGATPSRRGEAGAGGRRGECLPLTDDVVEAHLLGRRVVGVYPLLRDDTCWFLACDLDGPGWTLDALEYRRVCAEHGVAAYIERSRSGQGGHVWIFFSAPVPAVDARRLGAALLRITMEARAELDLASYDRFLPNQDFLPRGGFGNLIALPLQGDVRAAGNTVFLDDEMEAFSDQWRFLSDVDRLSPAALQAVLERLPSLEVGPGSAVAAASGAGSSLRLTSTRAGAAKHPDAFPAAHRAKLPEALRGTLGSGIAIERSGLPPRLLAALKHLASVHNPEFHQRQKLRLSTFRVPRLIRCYREDLTHLHLPRGLLDDLRELAEELGIGLELDDRRVDGDGTERDGRAAMAPETSGSRTRSLSFQGRLEGWQEEAVDALLEYDTGVLVAPPGAGKTVMACAVIAGRSVPTLVLAHRKTILSQWREQLVRFLGLEEGEIGQIGAGRERLTGRLDLAMLQTLARRGQTGEILSGYGLIVVDECHHIPAVSFENVIRQAPARRVLGLTATPWRRDGLEGLIELQCGPVRHRVGDYEAADDGVDRELIVRETSFRLPGSRTSASPGAASGEDLESPPESSPSPGVPAHRTADGRDLSIQEIFRLLVDDDDRTAGICADVEESLDEGRRCLVLSQWREHCHAIAAGLEDAGRRVELLDGTMSRRTLERALERIRQLPADRELAVVATGQLLGEGFDCPAIDTLFLVFPIAFKGRVVQYAGRLFRQRDGKSVVRIYDYHDGGVPVLRKMHRKRLKTYRSLGFREVGPGSGSVPLR